MKRDNMAAIVLLPVDGDCLLKDALLERREV